jgi:hypothetical protein
MSGRLVPVRSELAASTWTGNSDGIYECDPKFSPPPLPLADDIRKKGCEAK